MLNVTRSRAIHIGFAAIFLGSASLWAWATWGDTCGAEAIGGCLRDELRSWQTGFGAFFGLLGLAWTVFINADLNRAREERRINDRRIALAAVLYVEMRTYRLIIYRCYRVVADEKPRGAKWDSGISVQDNIDFLRAIEFPEPSIFQSVLSDLGLLSVAALRQLVETYEVVSLARQTIADYLRTSEEGRDVLDAETYGFFEGLFAETLSSTLMARRSLAADAGIKDIPQHFDSFEGEDRDKTDNQDKLREA